MVQMLDQYKNKMMYLYDICIIHSDEKLAFPVLSVKRGGGSPRSGEAVGSAGSSAVAYRPPRLALLGTPPLRGGDGHRRIRASTSQAGWPCRISTPDWPNLTVMGESAPITWISTGSET
jgi:hypothetical protein